MPSKTMRVASHLLGLGLEQAEHADQVELAGLHDVRREARIEEEQLLPFERRQVPAERRGVGDDLRACSPRRRRRCPPPSRCRAPLTSDCSAKTVLPQPGPPITSVVRPRGRPPSVISSKPWIPVGILATDGCGDWMFHRSSASRTCRTKSAEVNGFCTNGRPRPMPAVGRRDLLGVARHVQHPQPRRAKLQARQQLGPAASRHDHVGHHQIDRRGVLARTAARLRRRWPPPARDSRRCRGSASTGDARRSRLRPAAPSPSARLAGGLDRRVPATDGGAVAARRAADRP